MRGRQPNDPCSLSQLFLLLLLLGFFSSILLEEERPSFSIFIFCFSSEGERVLSLSSSCLFFFSLFCAKKKCRAISLLSQGRGLKKSRQNQERKLRTRPKGRFISFFPPSSPSLSSTSSFTPRRAPDRALSLSFCLSRCRLARVLAAPQEKRGEPARQTRKGGQKRRSRTMRKQSTRERESGRRDFDEEKKKNKKDDNRNPPTNQSAAASSQGKFSSGSSGRVPRGGERVLALFVRKTRGERVRRKSRCR